MYKSLATRGGIVALWSAALFLSACGGDTTGGVGSASAPTELAAWGEEARMVFGAIHASVGPGETKLDLHAGAKIEVPPNAFARSDTLHVSEVDLPLAALSFSVKSARTFVVSTDHEHSRLGSPVVLSVKAPKGPFGVMTKDATGWSHVRSTRTDDGYVRIEINHFSGHVFSILEWFAATRERIETTLSTASDPKHPLARERRWMEQGSPGVRAFYGVGETAPRPMSENCRLLAELVSSYTHADQYAIPSGSSVQELGLFLHAAQTPKQHGGYFHEVVSNTHDRIHRALLDQPRPVSPAGLLRIAIDATGGNPPLGVLAAHNYLKDITYRGRDTYDSKRRLLPDDCGLAAAKLETWRTTSSIAEGGYYDKMGPLYHIFAAMTATVWGGSLLGTIAVEGESFLRAVSVGADHPDMEKYAADACGVKVGLLVLARMGQERRKVDASPVTPSPRKQGGRVAELRHSKTTPSTMPRLNFHVVPDDGEWTIARVWVDGELSYVFEGANHGYYLPLPIFRSSYDITIDLRTATETFHEEFRVEAIDYRPPEPVDDTHPYRQKMFERLQGYLKKKEWTYAAGAQKDLALAWQLTDPARFMSMMNTAVEYCGRGKSKGEHFYLGPMVSAAIQLRDLDLADRLYRQIPEQMQGNYRLAMFEAALRLTGDIGVAKKYRNGAPIPEHLLRNRL